ncbi:FAD-dependent monooxygenase [Nocardia pseudovaccinii]|uniref:FAD-dependent monooxygenase n=1 Tax=Nocardia pseudovaccinii TaxID=189540 RepID=UPI0007A378FE|nr:FAD-dependent monooxygenase [Nocardia pseudovaccinii]
MTDRYDVIVAGAGPVGLIAALKLARAGVKVLVVDKLPSVETAPRAVGYQWPSPLVFEDVGILDDALEAGVKKTDMAFMRYADGRVDKITLKCLEVGEGQQQPYDIALGQDVLANIAVRHLEERPNAEFRWNSRVSAVNQDQDGVRVTVETSDGREEFRGAWLVGADGSHSTVRKLLDLPFEGHTWPDRFVATNAYYDFDAEGYAPSVFVRDAVNWAFIIKLDNNGLWRITYGEDSSLPVAGVHERMDAHYRALLPNPDRPWTLQSINSYQVHERCASTFRVGRILLAGDAAHVNNPSGGFGLLGGIYDANALAVSLIAVLEGTRNERVLDLYAEERRMIFLQKTSPQATQYKNSMMEPESIKRFDAFVSKAAADPHLMRVLVSPPQNLVGTFPLGPGARLD